MTIDACWGSDDAADITVALENWNVFFIRYLEKLKISYKEHQHVLNLLLKPHGISKLHVRGQVLTRGLAGWCNYLHDIR